jgi:hypothetical protein
MKKISLISVINLLPQYYNCRTKLHTMLCIPLYYKIEILLCEIMGAKALVISVS